MRIQKQQQIGKKIAQTKAALRGVEEAQDPREYTRVPAFYSSTEVDSH